MNDNVFAQDDGTIRTTSPGRKQFQTELAAYSLLFSSSNMPITMYMSTFQSKTSHNIKVLFLSQARSVREVNASRDTGTKKSSFIGGVKETEFDKKLGFFKSKSPCLGVAAEDSLFPTCTRVSLMDSRALWRHCRYLVFLLAKEQRLKQKILPLDMLLPGMIARSAHVKALQVQKLHRVPRKKGGLVLFWNWLPTPGLPGRLKC